VFLLYPQLEQPITGQCYDDIVAIKTAVTVQLCSIPESAFQTCRNIGNSVSLLGECISKVWDYFFSLDSCPFFIVGLLGYAMWTWRYILPSSSALKVKTVMFLWNIGIYIQVKMWHSKNTNGFEFLHCSEMYVHVISVLEWIEVITFL
jgi:hypothetical protein